MAKENDDIQDEPRFTAAEYWELDCINCGRKEDHTFCFAPYTATFFYKRFKKFVDRYERLYGKGENN